MRDIVLVLTCPNRGKSYLQDTLASLDGAGAAQVPERIVLVDGDPSRLCPPFAWQRRRMMRRPGNLHAVLEAFTIGAEYDRLLFFEDDVIACRNAVVRMRQVGVPDDCAFTTFFDMKEGRCGDPAGLSRVPAMGKDGRGFWGTQAVMFPQRTLRYLVDNKRFWVDAVPNKHSADALFSHQLLYSPWPQYALHTPNLVEHVGDVSSVFFWTPKVNRRSTSFPGEGFDALSLSP